MQQDRQSENGIANCDHFHTYPPEFGVTQINIVMSCTVPVWPVIYTVVVFHTAQLLA